MDDTQILDWLEQHYTKFREEGPSNGPNRFTLDYIGVIGDWKEVRGESLRDCVRKLLGKSG